MVYQQFINYSEPLGVREHRLAAARRAARRRPRSTRASGSIAELLHLTPLLERRPVELSGGQQQRTALARALVKDADLVLLDEPLANLDYKLREELRDELPRLFADRGCTVVYATTEPAEALLLGGHTATLHEGRVTQFGPTPTVYREPVDLTTRAGLLRPADQRRARRARAAADIVPRRAACAGRRRRQLRALPDGAYTVGAAPAPCAPAPGTAGVAVERPGADRRDHRLGERRALRRSAAPPGSRWRTACTPSTVGETARLRARRRRAACTSTPAGLRLAA